MPTKEKKNEGNSTFTKFIFLFLIAATVAVGYAMEKKYINLDVPAAVTSESSAFAPTGFNLTYGSDSKATFYSDGTGNFFYCTVDGIKYMAQDGSIKWDSPFTMTNPILLGRGQFACVAESDGRSFGVYGKSGKIYGQEFSEKILFFSLNENGYSTFLLRDGSKKRTLAFDPEGNEIFEMMHQTENIFPMVSEVSQDGRIIAMSFVNINSVALESNLVFAYTKLAEKVKLQDPDRIFKALDFKDQLIPSLRFMNDNVLIYISDTQIGGIYTDEKNAQKDWKHELNNKLDAVTFTGNKSFAVINGDAFLNREAEVAGLLVVYDTTGKRLAEYVTEPSKKISYLYGDENGLLLGNGREFQSVGLNGKLNYKYNSAQDVTQLMYLGNTNTLLQNTTVSAEILKKAKTDSRTSE